MKRRLLFVIVLGISLTPPVFAQVEKVSKTSLPGILCDAYRPLKRDHAIIDQDNNYVPDKSSAGALQTAEAGSLSDKRAD